MKKSGKKNFDKEMMYAKIMPSFLAGEPEEEAEETHREPEERPKPEQGPEPGYLLRNYMEDVVLEKVTHTMEMLKACSCEKCKKDVMARTLNSLPSAYMAVRPEEVEEQVKKLRNGVEVKVSAALIKAVQETKENPAH